MSKNLQSDPECVFCKIADKKIPSNIVYEDANFMAFLDINPMSPGHTLVIPKKHYRWVWDIPNVGPIFEITKKIAIAQGKAFLTDFVISKIIGDEVHHAHIWVYPNAKVFGDKLDFQTNAKRIIEKL